MFQAMNAHIHRDRLGDREDRRVKILGALLFVVAFAVFSPSINTGFVWDAEFLYTKYPGIQRLENLRSVFVTEVVSVERAEGERVSGLEYYRPLTKAYYILAYALFSENPKGYKVASVALHALVALLAFLFMVSVMSRPLIAFAATLFFATNPIHTEAVVWTYSVSYLLAALFSLLTLLLYRHGKGGLALVAYSAALLSHEIGVLLFPVLVVHKWLLEDTRVWKDYAALAPYGVLLVLFLALRASVVGGIPISGADPVEFLNTSAVVVQRYLKMYFWPDAPVTIYINEAFLEFSTEVLVSYAICILLAVLAFVFWRIDRPSLFWLLWFFAWISVSLNIGKLGEYLMAEKIMYTASIGICALIAIWGGRLFENRRRVAVICVIFVTSVQIYNTWLRVPHWQNTETYLIAGLEHAPDFYLANYSLGYFYVTRQRFDDALGYIEKTVNLNPSFTPGLNHLGNLYYLKGRLHEAISFWGKATVIDPTYPLPYFNTGLALRQLGRLEESNDQFEKYLEREPNPPPAVIERLGLFGYQVAEE